MIFLPGALPWGSLVAFLTQTLPLYPSSCPLLFQILLFSSTSLVAFLAQTLPLYPSGCPWLTLQQYFASRGGVQCSDSRLPPLAAHCSQVWDEVIPGQITLGYWL